MKMSDYQRIQKFCLGRAAKGIFAARPFVFV
jgi:hypothetical protein